MHRWGSSSDNPQDAFGGVSSVQEQVDALGFSWYQIFLLLGVGSASLVESMEMGIVSPLHTALARAYGLSRKQRAILPLVTYLGSMVGMVIAGPLADLWGRKRGLVFATLLLCLSCCIHAFLPAHCSFGVLVLLRTCSGVGCAVGIPTGISLAVESCAQKDRLWLVFAISFMGSLGYLIEALAIEWLMPHLGEEESDNWRGLCLFCGLPALASLLPLAIVRESPTFLAITGRWHECLEALDVMSYWNGRQHHQRMMHRRSSRIWRSLSHPETRGSTLWGLAVTYLPILCLLLMIDAMRSFFTSGSAYLCKDLFEMTRLNRSISPTSLNVIASTSPIIGLIIGERLVWMGLRCIMLGCAVIAASSLLALISQAVRGNSWFLLPLVLCYKLTYGPMGTCLALMKVEAFPTEFRATAFAAICVAAKLLCALGPTLVEALKEEEAATSWTPQALAGYLISLASAAFLAGLLSLRVPDTCSEKGRQLKDFSQPDLASDTEDDNEATETSAKVFRKYGSADDEAKCHARI